MKRLFPLCEAPHPRRLIAPWALSVVAGLGAAACQVTNPAYQGVSAAAAGRGGERDTQTVPHLDGAAGAGVVDAAGGAPDAQPVDTTPPVDAGIADTGIKEPDVMTLMTGSDAGNKADAAPTGLLARYLFDEGSGTSSADSTGRGTPIQLSCIDQCDSGSPPSWVPGRSGGAMQVQFYQGGRIAPAEWLNKMQSTFTIALWFYRDAVVDKDDRSLLGREVDRGDGTPAVRLSLLSGRLKAAVGGSDVRDTAVVPGRTWLHIAVRFDGSTLSLFKDGTRVAQGPATANFPATQKPFYIGTFQSGSTYLMYADGRFDDLRLYDVALPDDQIRDIAAAPP